MFVAHDTCYGGSNVTLQAAAIDDVTIWKLVAATGLAPVRSGLKDRSLDLLCIRGQNRLSGSYARVSTLPAVYSRRPDREVRTTSGQEWIQSDHQIRPPGRTRTCIAHSSSADRV